MFVISKNSKMILSFLVLTLTAAPAWGWQFFARIQDYVLTGTKDITHVHSEYYYGNCKAKGMKFFTHLHLDHMSVLGKVIIRSWLDIDRIPTCILLRATAYEYDMFRSTAYNFQICVPRITYCHSQKRYKFFYFEWYIPEDMIGGMNWDVYFYGPTSIDW